MIFFTLKIILAAIIIAFASWLSGQNPKLAGFIIALPLVSLIAIAFSYYEHNDIEKTILFNVQKKGIKAPLQVYRALDKLVEIGKIHKIESRNAFIACHNSSCQVAKATAFSICEICEKVTEISSAGLSKYLANFKDKDGMKYSKYNLEFFGLCKKCTLK